MASLKNVLTVCVIIGTLTCLYLVFHWGEEGLLILRNDEDLYEDERQQECRLSPGNATHQGLPNECSRLISSVPVSRRVLIRVGKTGSRTLVQTYPFRRSVHVSTGKKFKPGPSDHLVISVRNPIERLQSAWDFGGIYWEKEERWLCNTCHVGQCINRYFSSFNDFAERLDNSRLARRIWQNGCLEHFKENYAFYIEHLSTWILEHPCQVHRIRQEHMMHDMLEVFGDIPSEAWIHRSPQKHSASALSCRARKNLLGLLAKEYQLYYFLLGIAGLNPFQGQHSASLPQDQT